MFQRTSVKYGERGERSVHIEAGHAAENVRLQAVALGLGTTIVGAFSDAEVKRLLGFSEEEPLLLIPVAKPGEMIDLGPVLLLPVGRPAREDLETLSRDLSATGTTCKVGRSVPLPKPAYDRRRDQYLANAFLSLAAQAAPALADPRGKVLAVTEVDLYADDLNFVLGMAEFHGRTAVISLCRLGLGAGPDVRRSRALKEAVHELGHTLGLGHCPEPMCVMHFSNALADTDRKGHCLCAVCQRRLDVHRLHGPCKGLLARGRAVYLPICRGL